MLCLTDNDIIFKLAQMDLIDESLAAIGVSKSEVYVLPDVKYRFFITKRWGKAVEKFGEPVALRIKEFLSQVGEIDKRPTVEELLLFDDIIGVDEGEAILLCAARHYEASAIATGDKRCLKAILSSEACRQLVDELAGRLICLEQIIERLIGVHGFTYVRDKVVPATSCDTTMRAIFGAGLGSQPESVVSGLKSYIDEIRHIRNDALMVFAR